MAPLQPAPQIHGSRTLLKFLRVIADFGSDFSVPCAVIPNVVQEIQLEFQHFYFALQGEGRHGAEPILTMVRNRRLYSGGRKESNQSALMRVPTEAKQTI